jgi:hypothetical protein
MLPQEAKRCQPDHKTDHNCDLSCAYKCLDIAYARTAVSFRRQCHDDEKERQGYSVVKTGLDVKRLTNTLGDPRVRYHHSAERSIGRSDHRSFPEIQVCEEHGS